jgi:hypothetical protein
MTATTPNRLKIEAELGNPNLKYPTRHNARELKLLQTALYNKNIDDSFRQAPIVGFFGAAGAVLPAESAAGSVLGFHSGQCAYELYNSLVESTGTSVYKVPYVTSAGLIVPLDADLTDGPYGVEIGCGTTSRSRAAFTAGSEIGDFYCEIRATITTIAKLKEMWFGFRKAEAYQADCDDYDELACINVGLGATGRFNITKILNNAATSTTNTALTAWANAGQHTLRVIVRQNRTVEFWIDGVQSTVAAHTFDNGEVVLPFLYCENQSAADPVVAIDSFKCGYL